MADFEQSRGRRGKYIDLKINGRLFPSWLLANFKKYKLPEIIRGQGDPCNETVKIELKKYQLFLSQYLDYKSPYHDILIYHGLGSGKTGSSINIYNALYNYTPGWNVFILIKASLRDTWLTELKKFLQKDDYEHRMSNIHFIHYDSPIADRKFLEIMKNVDNSKKSMFIIDEVHNFIRNVYSNVSSSKGKRAQIIYDYIIQDKKENPDTRVILLSGTPAINNPFELALLFNLLRPGIFPKSENEFNHLFVSSSAYQTINKNNKNLFQRRILGLVSYYYGATPDYFASSTTHYIDVPMSEYHEQIYNFYEDIEKKIAQKAKFSSSGSQVYKSYTRQASNFVFPAISQRVNGENRPRPNKFRISEREAEKLAEGLDESKLKVKKSEKGTKQTLAPDKIMNITKYKNAMDSYINGLQEYYAKINQEDIKNKHTILDDVNTFRTKYESNFQEFVKNEKDKSALFNAMYESSAKMLNIIFNIMISPGPTIVYSNYVLMEGLEVFKILLSFFNFYSYMETKSLVKGKIGYVEFHGGIKEFKDRTMGMNAFNEPSNKLGEDIKIMLISPAGSEGLSLENVRQVHIMEPYWNEVRIQQMIGRGIRQCSHKALKYEDRHVDIYRYKSTKSKAGSWTTDEYIEDLARSKAGLIQSFLDAIKEVAVDCVLNKKHNMLLEEYKCFQFEEPALFDKYISAAYKDDIYDDMRIDNGSNSKKAISLKIKVMKIKAVILLSNPQEDNTEVKYSKPEVYWYYEKSHVVYDFDLHYAVGRIQIDQDGFPVKIDKDTYVIDYMIPIPLIGD